MPSRETPKFIRYGDAARVLSVEQKLSDREIARQLPLHAATVAKWRKLYGWDGQRTLLTQGAQGHVEDVALMLAQLIADAKKARKLPPHFFDDVAKGARAIDVLRGDVHYPAHLVRTMKLLMAYLQSIGKLELAQQLSAEMSGFHVYALGSEG